MKTTLEELNLTERDFNILIDGLEHLPSKDAASDLMFDLLTMSLMKDDPAAKAQMKEEKAAQDKKKKVEKELLLEDIKILQGKLTLFKRYLQENNLLKEANKVLGQ